MNKSKRFRNAGAIDAPEARKLHTRKQLKARWGRSISAIIRLEKAGVLTPIKLIPSQGGLTYYTEQNVLKVERGDV